MNKNLANYLYHYTKELECSDMFVDLYKKAKDVYKDIQHSYPDKEDTISNAIETLYFELTKEYIYVTTFFNRDDLMNLISITPSRVNIDIDGVIVSFIKELKRSFEGSSITNLIFSLMVVILLPVVLTIIYNLGKKINLFIYFPIELLYES